MTKHKQTNSIPGHQKYTIQDFNTEFPNDDACMERIKEERWPGGITVCDSASAAMSNASIIA